MPKSIVREFDKSTTGITLSSNFAVFVPGYLGSPKLESGETAADVLKEAKKAGLYYETDNIYKLNSQNQFIRYIGKYGGASEITAVAPEITQVITTEQQIPEVDKYRKSLTVAEFANIDKETEFAYYIGREITNREDPKYLQNGYLLKTFTNYDATRSTFILEKVTQANLYMDLVANQNYTANSYFKILTGKEGVDGAHAVDHMGNQLAYELLGLGYTIYFKPLVKGSTTAASQLAQSDFWAPLKNKSTYRLRYLISGGCYDASVAAQMKAIADFNNKVTIEAADTYGNETGRGDVIALLDIDENAVAATNPTNQAKLIEAFGNAAKALNAGSKYCAIFAPRVVYSPVKDSVYNPLEVDVAYPCSFHYLACAAYSQERFAEWYAVAGYTRGIASKPILYTTYNFGDIAINTLAPRVKNTYADYAINLILNERGNYYLWGNRTAEPLNADGLIFSHFLNIRQLCCTLKQVLYEASRKFTFDPNSDLLWINFVNAIRPTLENMKADQGISGYKISKVATDKKALLVAKIRIVPIEAVEDFDISVYLQDSLSGIIVDTDEEVVEE